MKNTRAVLAWWGVRSHLPKNNCAHTVWDYKKLRDENLACCILTFFYKNMHWYTIITKSNQWFCFQGSIFAITINSLVFDSLINIGKKPLKNEVPIICSSYCHCITEPNQLAEGKITWKNTNHSVPGTFFKCTQVNKEGTSYSGLTIQTVSKL